MSSHLLESTVSLSLTVKEVAPALEFYKKAFGAVETFQMAGPDGAIAHAEFLIGNNRLFISSESPEWSAYAFADGAMSPCLFVIDVDNCDESAERAINAGAKPLTEPTDQFFGFRTAMVLDNYGYRWNVRQLIEEVSPEEMTKRAKALFG